MSILDHLFCRCCSVHHWAFYWLLSVYWSMEPFNLCSQLAKSTFRVQAGFDGISPSCLGRLLKRCFNELVLVRTFVDPRYPKVLQWAFHPVQLTRDTRSLNYRKQRKHFIDCIQLIRHIPLINPVSSSINHYSSHFICKIRFSQYYT